MQKLITQIVSPLQTSECAKKPMSDRPGQVENNLVPTCKPLAWLVRRTSEFLIRKILKQLKIDLKLL